MVVNNRRIVGRGRPSAGGSYGADAPLKIHTQNHVGNSQVILTLGVEGRTAIHVERQDARTYWIGLGEKSFYIHEPSGAAGRGVHLLLAEGQPAEANGFRQTYLKDESDVIADLFATRIERLEMEWVDKHSYYMLVDEREYRFVNPVRRGPGLWLLAEAPVQ